MYSGWCDSFAGSSVSREKSPTQSDSLAGSTLNSDLWAHEHPSNEQIESFHLRQVIPFAKKKYKWFHYNEGCNHKL